jgi:DNA-binding NtrC family response regulator
VILVIDDSREFSEVFARDLRRRGHDVETAATGRAGLALAASRSPALVFLDVRLADMSGLDVLAELRAAMPAVDVVIVTAFPELSSALAALRGKVLDYLVKPFSAEEVDTVLAKAFAAREGGPDPVDAVPAPDLVGASKATRELRSLIVQLAGTGVRAVLITGESGTGKDVAARLFHAASPRRHGPFVEVNCSAVSESLFESEFFGHERGAFTGAVATRPGFAELADGGVLFLDEVAEIPLSSQPKLLRFLEDQTFVRVGAGRKIKVDVQIVAATNRDLRRMVEQWAFRPDLYFRLNVVPITMPPLRSRVEDILPIAAYWLADANRRYGRRVTGFAPDAEMLLLGQPWPGNVRELRNLVERLVILCPGDTITAGQFPPEYGEAADAPALAREGIATLEELERAHIQRVLARVDGNKTKAAEILGISRQTLRTKIEG